MSNKIKKYRTVINTPRETNPNFRKKSFKKEQHMFSLATLGKNLDITEKIYSMPKWDM